MTAIGTEGRSDPRESIKTLLAPQASLCDNPGIETPGASPGKQQIRKSTPQPSEIPESPQREIRIFTFSPDLLHFGTLQHRPQPLGSEGYNSASGRSAFRHPTDIIPSGIRRKSSAAPLQGFFPEASRSHVLHNGLGEFRTFDLSGTVHLARQIVGHNFILNGSLQTLFDQRRSVLPAQVLQHHSA